MIAPVFRIPKSAKRVPFGKTPTNKPFNFLFHSKFSFNFSFLNLRTNQGLILTNDILTVREVAQFLRLTEKTAYRYALEGKIPGFKVGGAWRFRKDQIEELTQGIPVRRIKNAS